MKMEDAAPLLQKVAPLPIPPFLLNEKFYDTLAEIPSLFRNDNQPLPSWTFARKRPSGEVFPQTIAHRGYKANHPENTMGAFVGAATTGAHAIETDIHKTKDDILVLSHDATLKRCFEKDEKIKDCTWDYISQQRTIRAPHEPMPRLRDLLEYLASPGLENIWLLLDIKLDNDSDTVMRLIAETIASIPPNPLKPWNQRVVLGCWAAKYLPLCAEYLPTFSITHIGFSIPYARQFFSVPNVSFNILQKTIIFPFLGARFIREAKEKGRPIFTWTVDDEDMMRWAISKRLDAVITDDPKKFLEVCEDWERGKRDIHISSRQWFVIFWTNLMILIFGAIFWWKYGGMGKQKMKKGSKEDGQTMPFSAQEAGRR